MAEHRGAARNQQLEQPIQPADVFPNPSHRDRHLQLCLQAGTQQAAVESLESALLQQDADLESGGLEAPSLIHQASEQAAVEGPDAAPRDQRAFAGRMGLAPQQLLTTVTEEQAPMGLWHTDPALAPAKLKEYLTHSLLIISMAIGILINLFFIRSAKEPLSKNPSLIVACASASMSLISGFGLAIDIMKQMKILSSSPPRHLVRDSPYSWSKLFLCLSTVSLAFTVISIIVSFLPEAYHYLPVVLVPTLLVVGVSFYDAHRRDHVVNHGDDDPHNDCREHSFQLTVNMTGFSFTGALGTIISYHKNYSNRASPVYVKVSIYFMLGAAITGLFVLQLLSRRKGWKKTAVVGNAIVLGLLVLAVFIVSATFLGGVLAATLFPLAVAAAIWYLFEYHVPRGDLGAAFSQEEEVKLLYTGALTAMSVTFGAIMTTFAGFLGGQEKSGHLEVFIFFVVSCFVSSVSLGVITFRAPKKASLGAAARALACLTLVLLVLAALAMVSYVD